MLRLSLWLFFLKDYTDWFMAYTKELLQPINLFALVVLRLLRAKFLEVTILNRFILSFDLSNAFLLSPSLFLLLLFFCSIA